MVAPAEREFRTVDAGEIRDRVILANWRNGLRQQTNPATGNPYTEAEIRRATQERSRWWIQANGDDQLIQAEQRNALWLADQVPFDRASTRWLDDRHATLWGEPKLPAAAGGGTVTVTAVAGTVVVGSTTIGSPSAYRARDAAGNSYQVLASVTVGASGTATVSMKAITPGAGTNPVAGTVLTWTYKDPNMVATATVATDFEGGTAIESDGDHAQRLADTVRHKQGAGNSAQIRAWGRKASTAVEEAFVYPCAAHAGSTLVALTRKRGSTAGPDARIPSTAILATGIAYLTPPTSPRVPERVYVLVVPVQAEDVDLALRLDLPAASAAGWTDAVPFPSYHATTPSITTVTSQTNIEITCTGDSTLPGQSALATLSGASAPQLMVWNEAASEFELLTVASVEDLGSNVFNVILGAAPSFTLATGQIVSPALGRHALVSAALTEYFDERGPGELFNTSSDPRGARCQRFIPETERYPSRVGSEVATRAIEALGGTASNATAPTLSKTSPSYPSDLTLGPYMLTLGTAGVYAL